MFEEDKDAYFRGCRVKVLFILACILLTAAVFVVSLTLGFYDMDFMGCFETIVNHITGNITDTQADSIIWGSRLPIAVFAVIAGATLSVSGAVMQTVLRNPLADPYTMGISSGAGLGASLAIILGISVVSGLGQGTAVTAMAFLFSLIPVAVILVFSVIRKTTPTRVVLIGVAVMYMFSACTTLLMVTADDESLAEVYAWNVGSLATITWDSIPLALVVSVVCMVFIYLQHRRINILSSDEATAHSLGVDPRRTTIVALIAVSLMTAAAVSFCGTIGFVGLVGPHIARILVGSESHYLIPASASFGALFLLGTNIIAMNVGTFGLPVGVISALVGCPLFILILLRMRRNEWM